LLKKSGFESEQAANSMYAHSHRAQIVFDVPSHEETEPDANQTFYSHSFRHTFAK